MPDVDIDLIKPSPYQPRLTFDVEDIRGSITRYGIRAPLTVRQRDNYYELIDGERRLRLANELGYKTVPCHVIDVDDETARRLVWQMNTLRKPYAPKETAFHLKKLQEIGLSIRAIGRECSYSHQQVMMYLDVFKLPEEYQEAVWEGRIPIGNIGELGPLFNSGGQRLPEVLQWLDQRLTKEELRNALKPTLAKFTEQQIQKAQEAVGEIAPEITIETPEDLEEAAEALRKEARRQRKEAMTPEEKAEEERKKLVAEARKSLNSTTKKIDRASQVMDVSEFRERLSNIEQTLEKAPSEAKAQLTALGQQVTEAENKAKAEAKAKQEEEQRQKKAEEERRREERADAKAREKYKGDKEFVRDALKDMPEEEVAEMLNMVPIPDKVKKVKTVDQEFDEIMKMASKVVDNLDKLKKDGKIEQLDLKRFSITLRILADCLDEFAKLAEGRYL